MRIFIFTTCFAPGIGGIERLTELLATQFSELGHDVVLATRTPGPAQGPWRFAVVRRPSPRRFWSLLRGCDVHLQANLSLKYIHAVAAARPFVVTHQGDYTRAGGGRGPREHLKLACARLVHGVACSRHVARRVGCRELIANPYDDAVFRRAAALEGRVREIVFLGRLVTEKGCDTLLEAISILSERGVRPSCTVIGDGPERVGLIERARAGGIADRVRFVGALRGQAIADELNRHAIMVVPSRYREPFGIVALEGLACGCLPIVSADGGLVDAIGPHGLTFRNGDPLDLADRLEQALGDPRLARRKLEGADVHLSSFTARRIAEQYLDLFERLLRRRYHRDPARSSAAWSPRGVLDGARARPGGSVGVGRAQERRSSTDR